MNEMYVVNDEIFEKAAKMTAERADKMYLAFKEKGYNNDTCAEFTKQLLLSIYRSVLRRLVFRSIIGSFRIV